jgi:exoribonuclease R
MGDWIPGTLELASKVRYGITSRGVPIFRFVPYDRLLRPLAVGCSQRDLFHNVHAIVAAEPVSPNNTLQKGIIIQNLGQPTDETELQVLLANYAYDCNKSLRYKESAKLTTSCIGSSTTKTNVLEGFTFNIDPPGCKDVDDSFTVKLLGPNQWEITINIADVASLIQEGSDIDIQARLRATTFYSLDGNALSPMFPPEISEGAASLGSDESRPTLSLEFIYEPPNPPHSFKWIETVVRRTRSFTYDEAQSLLHKYPELQVIKDLTKGVDSHEWVERLMILYNTKAGEALKAAGKGILRCHSAPAAEKLAMLAAIDPAFSMMAYDAATFCVSDPHADTKHFGLDTDAYAYASSPIRRYCDLVNQRALKSLISGEAAEAKGGIEELISHLNRRQKQAKAFTRDLFFMTQLSDSKDFVEGTVISINKAIKMYVPVWKRCIKVRSISNQLREEDLPPVGSKVSIDWYCDREGVGWKERIVFKLR